ncbi:FeFe-hydrogenase assembly protein HydF [Spironucleus salmonicida]|uniref:FeFe-hydrogenase assembly protein HydF n=1 Tax=Spironucleus salmonicida TaxID=348837 RepID=K7R5E8_9EUKA|nr:FeFe-hydrogenase assembly protein HydF [Spironucleus salmonicida]KAH0571157.1 FeFe-hydrogenase assembly protein HydF [Spironucleus salmonicida]|eukprot:EST43253.1 [FeFe]-hydrogenase assembly protein HydF [Spironucleus salmonicida]
MSLTPSTDRVHISILGRMNAGKSTFINALTNSNISIVDSTPGTTADAKISLMQLHKLGPAKIFDCAGMDEEKVLGAKKLKKTMRIAKMSDLVIHVIEEDNLRNGPLNRNVISQYERKIKNQPLGIEVEQIIKNLQGTKSVINVVNFKKAVTPLSVYEKHYLNGPIFAQNLQKTTSADLCQFLEKHADFDFLNTQELIPKFLKPNDNVLMITPLDREAPKQRLLRPQAMALEAFLANKISVTILNLDLQKYRAGDVVTVNALKNLASTAQFILTDSQAVDIIAPLKRPFSTFSIQQIRYLAGEYFDYLINSLDKFKNAKNKRVLIAEACTHDRLTSICEDIGTRQIPDQLKKLGAEYEFSFGKDDEILEKQNFDLAIHCGGCMISKQQVRSRLKALVDKGIPVTNYGMFLAFAKCGSVGGAVEVWK